MHSFYPGLAAPTLPSIDGGATPAGNITAPEGYNMSSDSENDREGDRGPRESMFGAGRRISASRPTRVVGVLEHPVTPVPPVSLAMLT